MRIPAVICAVLLTGCVGPMVEVHKVDDVAAASLAEIALFGPGQAVPVATSLGPVNSTSCKNKLWDKAASETDGMNQLRFIARQRGGNAVTDAICQRDDGALLKNCWEAVTCSGTAVQLKR